MNATKRSAARIGLVFCSALALAATGCVVRERTRTVYVQAPAPVISAPPEPVLELPPPAHSPVVVIQSERDFYEPLEVYGRWAVVGTYGRCWIPARVEVGWRPYSNGCWQRTDAGWYWASDEPWGWATYHYGRWDLHAEFGWFWVPHTQWAPAWVCWREGGGYVGWAPLRPSVSIGVSIGVGHYEPAFASRAFVFVEHRRMLEPVRPKTVIVNNTTIINKTVNITKVNVEHKTVINEGPRPEVVERKSGRKIRPVPVHELRNKEETIVAARERNIPTVASRRGQPPVRTESPPAQPPTTAPRHPQVVEKAPVNDRSAEHVTEPSRPSAIARPRPARVETERPAHEERKHEAETAKKVIPPSVAPVAKPEPGVPGRAFHPDEVAARPTAQPGTISPGFATGPASRELESRNDARSETKRDAKQTTKVESAPPAEDRTHGPVKHQIKPERAVPAGRDSHPNAGKAATATPPAFDETRRDTPTHEKGATEPASSELASRNEVRSETKRDAKQTAKVETAPPTEDQTHRPVKHEVKPERAVPAGRASHPDEGRAVTANPTSQPITTNPARDETRRYTPAKGGPASNGLESRNEVRSETKRDSRQIVNVEAAPTVEERTQQISPKEKARTAERAPASKKAKEAKEQKKAEEQETTTPAPGSPRQPR